MNDQRGQRRLEDLHPAEVPELLRVASQLYAQDRAEMEREAQHRELLRAAAEAGLPPEYLERAAAALTARQVARKRQQGGLLLGGVLLAAALSFLLAPAQRPLDPPPPVPPSVVARPALPPPSPTAVASIKGVTPIDLSEQVNYALNDPMLDTGGNDLSELGAGIRMLGGVPFRVSGVVLVGPSQTEGDLTNGSVPVPRSIEGISIGQKAKRLYFLEGTHFSASSGAKIGAYRVHYMDGTQEEVPIRYSRDVLDWWDYSESGTDEALAHVVWHGRNEAASSMGYGIRLFMQRWENPHPERKIETLDFTTGDQAPGAGAPTPFVVAITAG